MIISKKDYQASVNKIKLYEQERVAQVEKLRGEGVSEANIKSILAPTDSFYAGIKDDVLIYEQIVSGQMPEYFKFVENMGRLLVALRMRRGWSQSRLAEELGVAKSQVCRDEKNEYHGASIQKFNKITKVLGYKSLKLNI